MDDVNDGLCDCVVCVDCDDGVCGGCVGDDWWEL